MELTCELERDREMEKRRSEIKKYGLIYSKSEYGETENGVNDLKRRKVSGFVGV